MKITRKFAFGLTVIPLDWQVGVWHKEHKSIVSFGPLRFVYYPNVGNWKE